MVMLLTLSLVWIFPHPEVVKFASRILVVGSSNPFLLKPAFWKTSAIFDAARFNVGQQRKDACDTWFKKMLGVFVEGGHLDGQIGGVQLLHSNHGASDVGLFFWSASLRGGKWFSKQKACQFVCWKKVKDVEMFSSTGFS